MSQRRRVNLNREWRFARGDHPGAEAPGFDDSDWQRVGLPHTFDLPYFRTPEFYVGVGWYRKSIRHDDVRHKRCALEFEGAFQVAEIFVNGRRVGDHRGGYTGFDIDITDALSDGENCIAVRVSNNWDAQLAPRAGEHIFSGGIYRDVWLLCTDQLHIAPNGVRITTPIVCHDAGAVRIRTEVHNESEQPKNCTLESIVFDADDRPVARMKSTQTIAARTSGEFDQTSDAIDRPDLWHPDHPYLYKVRTTVFDEDELVDELESSFGFRFFEWTADRGFFLNGEHLYLRGANVHQDHAGWGIAVTRAECWRDVKLMKDAGFNFIRGAHYPHHPAFADACDRLGMLLLSENCFWGKGGFGPEGYWNASAYPVDPKDFKPFEAHCKQTLREMIESNRNHPSIVAWSMTNEAFFTYNLDRARNLIGELVKLSHELDSTRPAAIGGAQRGEVDRLGDIACYNGDGARLFIDPGVPNMVSEYGAISKPHDAFDPFFGELREEQFPWRAGQAIWCGFDYGTIAGRQGLKGIVDHFRLPKRSWYWYRNQLLKIPPPQFPQPGAAAKLMLSADKTTIHGTDATDDCQIIVTVLDATGRHISPGAPGPITLEIESGPGEFPTGPSITFDAGTDIPIVNGQAAIEFRSYHAGQSRIRATSPGLADATITITTIGEPAYVEGVTPPVEPRPYHPPAESEAARQAMRNAVNVALNRPCRATSEAEGYPARHANDGDPSTSWRAAEPAASWLIDLEGFYQLASLRLTFESDANYRFIVELSNDMNRWTVAIDRSRTDSSRALRNDIFPPGAVARYLRVRFVHAPPAANPNLTDIQVHGVLSVR